MNNKFSNYITRRQAKEVLNAYRFSEQQFRYLDVFVTAHLDIDDPIAAYEAMKNVRNRFAKYSYRSRKNDIDFPLNYILVRENGNVHHFHMMTHIPHQLGNRSPEMFSRWIADYADVNVETTDIRQLPERQDRNNALNYMLKGIDPMYAEEFNLTDQVERGSQGIILGQRTMVSRSLGPKARRDAGFKYVPKRLRGYGSS